MGERLQEKRENIDQNISRKGGNNASSGFHNAAQSLRKGKKSQDSRNSKSDQKGRNRHNQQRKKENNDRRSRGRSNNQHNSFKLSTNKPLNGLHQLKLRKRKGEKSDYFFAK